MSRGSQLSQVCYERAWPRPEAAPLQENAYRQLASSGQPVPNPGCLPPAGDRGQKPQARRLRGRHRQRRGRAGALAQRPGRQVGSRCAKQMRSRAGLEREGAGSRRRRRPTRVLLSCQRGGTGSTESGQPPGGRHERHSEPETTTAHARRGSPHSNHRSRASGLGPAATLPPLGAPAALPDSPGRALARRQPREPQPR